MDLQNKSIVFSKDKRVFYSKGGDDSFVDATELIESKDFMPKGGFKRQNRMKLRSISGSKYSNSEMSESLDLEDEGDVEYKEDEEYDTFRTRNIPCLQSI